MTASFTVPEAFVRSLCRAVKARLASGVSPAYKAPMTAFRKMHGLGNDFVVFDARNRDFALEPRLARALADRREGIGCDQVIVIAPGKDHIDAFMRIYNADGGEVESCGNAARCVARLLMEEGDTTHVRLDSSRRVARLHGCRRRQCDSRYRRTASRLARNSARAGRRYEILRVDGRRRGADGVGGFGRQSPLHPVRGRCRARSSFRSGSEDRASSDVSGPHQCGIREPHFAHAGCACGCGSVASASRAPAARGRAPTAVAAVRLGLAERRVDIVLDGGTLALEWRESDGHVLMTGPVALAYTGEVDVAALGYAA
jgi:diaminopimelate epimerase